MRVLTITAAFQAMLLVARLNSSILLRISNYALNGHIRIRLGPGDMVNLASVHPFALMFLLSNHSDTMQGTSDGPPLSERRVSLANETEHKVDALNGLIIRVDEEIHAVGDD